MFSANIQDKPFDFIFARFDVSSVFGKFLNFCPVANGYSLQNDKTLDWFKLKAFADDKINVIEKLKFVLERVENIVGKGENAGYQYFLLSPTFSKGFLYRVIKSRDSVVKSSGDSLLISCLYSSSVPRLAKKNCRHSHFTQMAKNLY